MILHFITPYCPLLDNLLKVLILGLIMKKRLGIQVADYYETLGLGRGASDAEIKKAYRRLAMQYHPDRNAGDKASEEEFKKVSEAYAVLSDPQKKKQYDTFGSA